MKADTRVNKVEHLLEIARSLEGTGIASCGNKYFANVEKLFIVPLLKGNASFIIVSSALLIFALKHHFMYRLLSSFSIINLQLYRNY